MSRLIREFDSIRDVLIASIGNRITIILSSGRILRVNAEAVRDNLLIASFDGRIITININSIDVVVTRCRQLFGAIINSRQSRPRYSCSDGSRSREALGIVADSRSRTAQMIADDSGSSRRIRSTSDLAFDRNEESRRNESPESDRFIDPVSPDRDDSPVNFGYIRHEGNSDRYFC